MQANSLLDYTGRKLLDFLVEFLSISLRYTQTFPARMQLVCTRREGMSEVDISEHVTFSKAGSIREIE